MAKDKKKVVTIKRKVPRKESAKAAYDRGELGVVLPQGKPNEMSMADYVRSILCIVKNGKALGDQILERQAALAVTGNSKAAEFLFDRAYGKPTQNISVTSPPQVVVEHSVINIDEVPKT